MKFGKAFSDSVVLHKKQETNIWHDKPDAWYLGRGRILLFTVILFVSFFILVIRMFHLTIVKGNEYRSIAESNRTRELVRHAPRGIIRDRTGKPLVTNVARYRLLYPCPTKSEGSKECSKIISKEEGEKISKTGLQPGEFLEVDYERTYPSGSDMAHLIGYTGEITKMELDEQYFQLRAYRSGDKIGRSGVEAVFEDRLRGRDGKELVEVDATGKLLRTLGIDREQPGTDVTLAVDASLSRVVAGAFPAGRKGAIVVTKPSTGEVLALYSSPSFDPEIFSQTLSTDTYRDVLKNPEMPLFNRAVGGEYPPGSTFKLITAVAGLEDKAITSQTTIVDTGVVTIGTFSFANWYFTQYGKTEGAVDIVKALQRSNDIFFYKVGERLGITKLAAWAKTFGMGRLTGIELDGESPGLMPDPAWKKKHFSTQAEIEARMDAWYTGDTYHAAIGQGYMLATPLQVNTWTNIVADNGILCRPTVEKIQVNHKRVCQDLSISPDTVNIVVHGMVGACGEGGTGWPLVGFGIPKSSPAESSSSGQTKDSLRSIPVACKTGTAEFGDPTGKTHAWFTVFAPVPEEYLGKSGATSKEGELSGDPEITVTVLIEEGGEGSSVAAPIAKTILTSWFGR